MKSLLVVFCITVGLNACIKKGPTNSSQVADYQVEDPKNRSNVVIYLDKGMVYRVECKAANLGKTLTRLDCPHETNEHKALTEQEYRSRLSSVVGNTADSEVKAELSYKQARLKILLARQEEETKKQEANAAYAREDFLPIIKALEEQIQVLLQKVEQEKAVDALMAFFRIEEQHQSFSVESEAKLILKPFER